MEQNEPIIPVPMSLANAILTYLGDRPAKEVMHLILALGQAAKASEQPKPDPGAK
jgi:hypothetical protein